MANTAISPATRIAQINKQVDSMDDDMLNLLRSVNDYAEIHGWGDKLVKRGLNQITIMERRLEELRDERRQLYAATTARAS